MKVRRIGYATYRRNEAFWLDQSSRGVEIEVTRNGSVFMVLFGEPEVVHESTAEKLRRNKIVIQPSRKQIGV